MLFLRNSILCVVLGWSSLSAQDSPQGFESAKLLEQAFKDKENSISDGAVLASWYARLGAVMELQGRFTEAIRFYKFQAMVTSQEPDWFKIGHLGLDAGDTDLAEEASNYLMASQDREKVLQGVVLRARFLRESTRGQESADLLEQMILGSLEIPTPGYLFEMAMSSTSGDDIKGILRKHHPQSPQAQFFQAGSGVLPWGLPLVIKNTTPRTVQLGAFNKQENAASTLGKLPENLRSKVFFRIEAGLHKLLLPLDDTEWDDFVALGIPFILKKP